jgi:hypothetical protein
MHLLPNTITRLEAETIFVLEGSEAGHWRSGGCLEDLMILAVTVLQAVGCKAYRGLEARRRAGLCTA